MLDKPKKVSYFGSEIILYEHNLLDKKNTKRTMTTQLISKLIKTLNKSKILTGRVYLVNLYKNNRR